MVAAVLNTELRLVRLTKEGNSAPDTSFENLSISTQASGRTEESTLSPEDRIRDAVQLFDSLQDPALTVQRIGALDELSSTLRGVDWIDPAQERSLLLLVNDRVMRGGISGNERGALEALSTELNRLSEIPTMATLTPPLRLAGRAMEELSAIRAGRELPRMTIERSGGEYDSLSLRALNADFADERPVPVKRS